MKAIGDYLPCFNCGDSYEWMCTHKCPKCSAPTEWNLDQYHEHMLIVEKQEAEHAMDDEDYSSELEYLEWLEEMAKEDSCVNTIFDGTSDYDRTVN